MSVIQIHDLTFAHLGGDALFSHVDLELDSAWRLGLVGRNGRGKTTFLKLLMGQLEYTGTITAADSFEYFPVTPENPDRPALSVARRMIAPFDEWEARMQALAEAATPEAMAEYGELQERYAAADGYTIDELIAAETGKLGIVPQVLERPFSGLSGGEQVKLMLAALFLKKHRFLLIDEPTDHLDAEGRRLVGRWLAGKSGFILVSHDRAFLDEAVDHILSINRSDIELQKGNYSSWRHNRTLQDEFELAENRKLEAGISRLKAAAERTERWSDKIEKSKKSSGAATYDRGPASVDRGYIGHQAARMMQRSKSIERRRQGQIEQKKSLLKNIETVEPLKFPVLLPEKKTLLTGEGVALCFGPRCLFEGLDFKLEQGDRLAVQGVNGSGKSSLLKLVVGDLAPTAGRIWRQSGLVTSTLPQDTGFLSGGLRAFAEGEGIDLSLFMTLLRKLDFEREAFERDIDTYSAGQRKKVCLAASLARPAHLFIWDEPLNYIDVLSREQVEQAALASGATMLFVEHDAAFVQKVATGVLAL
ncbi:ATP-binding cassette domain-containing protein [Ruminococcaceae bacterium OttesenSCG-928-D13]|nr:ATP-binding cassette domain-containing protein [Ruminococcaceae bacterium OttesenSCG-928-D13]